MKFILLLAIIAFGALAVSAHRVAYFPWDLEITRSFQALQLPLINFPLRLVSVIGNQPQMAVIVGAVALLIYILGGKWEGLTTAGGVLAGGLANSLVKILVNRPRPSADLVSVLMPIHNPDFPSGHVFSFTVFFGFLFFLSYTLLKHSKLRTLLLVVFGLMIILIGPSRVYLGAHWASDVLGGYLFGSIWLAATIQVYQQLKSARRDPVASQGLSL
jgi:membrane-associated phospholipid phosphatase